MQRLITTVVFVLVTLSISADALAQRALVVRDSAYWWGSGCPVGAGVEQQLFDEGVDLSLIHI